MNDNMGFRIKPNVPQFLRTPRDRHTLLLPAKFFGYGISSKNFYLSHKSEPKPPSTIYEKCYSNILDSIKTANSMKNRNINIQGIASKNIIPKKIRIMRRNTEYSLNKNLKPSSELLLEKGVFEGKSLVIRKQKYYYDYPGKIQVSEQNIQTEKVVTINLSIPVQSTTESRNNPQNLERNIKTARPSTKRIKRRISSQKKRPKTAIFGHRANSVIVIPDAKKLQIEEALSNRNLSNNCCTKFSGFNKNEDEDNQQISLITGMLKRGISREKSNTNIHVSRLSGQNTHTNCHIKILN